MKKSNIPFNSRVQIIEHDGQWGFHYSHTNRTDWIGPSAPFLVARGFSRIFGFFN